MLVDPDQAAAQANGDALINAAQVGPIAHFGNVAIPASARVNDLFFFFHVFSLPFGV